MRHGRRVRVQRKLSDTMKEKPPYILPEPKATSLWEDLHET